MEGGDASQLLKLQPKQLFLGNVLDCARAGAAIVPLRMARPRVKRERPVWVLLAFGDEKLGPQLGAVFGWKGSPTKTELLKKKMVPLF